MKHFLIAVMLLFNIQLIMAQNTITGKITDETGATVPGVSISVKGVSGGTISDLDGNYVIQVPADASILIYNSMGYKTQEVEIGGRTSIDIVLETDMQNIDEVVVVGYGTQKKSDVTGAVGSVDMDETATEGLGTIEQALQGRVPGVQIVANTGAPGGSISVRIRGIATVNNSDPLYVVDGLPTDNINYLSPNDIASIEVLKDASASAIYGARGANGVVLVTTKKGSYNTKTNMNLSAYYGIQLAINNWETTSGSEYLQIQSELNKTRKKPLDLSVFDKNQNTDWFKEITRQAIVKNINFNINGGTEKIAYSLSLGHFDQEGTINKTDFNRNNIKFNTEIKPNNFFSLGANVNIRKSERHAQNFDSYHTGIINTAIKIEPVVPVYQSNGSYDFSKLTDYPNPVAQIEYNNLRYEYLTVAGNVFGQFNIFKWLNFKTSLGMSTSRTDNYNFTPTYEVNVNQRNLTNKVTRGENRTDYYNWENTLNFNKQLGQHSFSGLLGYTIEETKNQWINATKDNVPNEAPFMWYLSAATEADNVSGSGKELSYMSYLGRLNYAFANKYLLTVNFRADASSRFAEKNRWGYFPSFAVGWKLSEEGFMQNANWITTLKLRAGWGQVGNDKIGYYPYQSTMDGNRQYRYLFGVEENVSQGYVVTSMVDENIKWEIVESINVGLDAMLFDGKIELSFDWYKKTTRDMLLAVPMPYYYGYEGGPVANVGDVENKGIEFSINHKNTLSNGFEYNIGFNIATVKNKVTAMGNANPFSAGDYYLGQATRFDIDEPIGYFYGYKTDGVFQTEAEIKNHAVQQGTANEGLQPGDMKFVDVNGDGVIDDEDRTKIGNPIPDFTYGINMGIAYKGFDLSVFFQGSYGNEIFNAMKTHLYRFDETNKHKDMLNSWTPNNTNTDMPRLNGNDNNNTNRTSDRFVEDGSYLRLKNLTIGYSLPGYAVRSIKLTSLRVYFSAQNLWTLTKYSGADPEIGQRSSDNYLSRGVDIGTYPQSNIYTFGINIGF